MNEIPEPKMMMGDALYVKVYSILKITMMPQVMIYQLKTSQENNREH